MPFEITPQHAAIFSWVTDPTPRNPALIIDAVAGSGKSSTLIEILRLIPPHQTAVFLAFGHDAAAEIGAKADRAGLTRAGIQFRTLNSMGFRGVISSRRGVSIDRDIVKARLRARLTGRDEFKAFGYCVAKMVAAAKSQGLVPEGAGAKRSLMADNDRNWRGLMEQFQINPPDDDFAHVDKAIALAREQLRIGLRDMRAIDFDDQLYLPFAHRLPLPRFHWVLIDEVQDCNVVQRALLADALLPGGRVIGVGDKNQAIFAWRGADSDSMAGLAREYDATTLPLSTTYRCPQVVTQLAQTWVPHFACPPSAPTGTIRHIEGDEAIGKIEWASDDLILCRNNAPLVKMAYRLLRQRVPCRVAGRAIGTAVSALIRKMRARDPVDLAVKLKAHKEAQTAKILRANPDDTSRVEALHDEVDTAMTFAEESQTLADLDRMIAQMFSDDETVRLTLSSIHRAKGQERRRVFVLDPWRMPSPMARTAETKQQEKNLQYVAATRAREELVYMTLTPKPKPEQR